MYGKLFFTLAFLVVCSHAAFTEVPYGSADWSVSHISTVYNIQQQTTTFRYNISVDSDLSHWFLGIEECIANLADAPENEFFSFVTEDEMTTATNSYYYNMGQDSESHPWKEYAITFQGKVGTGSVDIVLAGNGDFTTLSGAPGPSCDASIGYPEIECPADVDHIECSDDDLEILDNDIVTAGICYGNFEITRYHRFSANGLTSQCVQHINVEDTLDPEFTTGIDHVVVLDACKDTAPPVLELENHVTDACAAKFGKDVIVNFCQEENEGQCPHSHFITRTWTATDECGNSKCITQTVVFEDNNPPTIHGVPEDEFYNCTKGVTPSDFPAINVTATDDCDCDDIQLIPSQEVVAGHCGNTFQIKRTYTAIDCCGNEATDKYYINVVDEVNPTLSFVDPDPKTSYDCTETPTPPAVQVDDNCDDLQAPEPTIEEHSSSCPENRNFDYVWKISDACGNEDELRLPITVTDSTAPNFKNFPNDTNIECGSPIPNFNVICDDDCADDFAPEITPFIMNGTCENEKLFIFQFTCTDGCDNSRSRNWTVVQFDSTDPEIDEATLPDDEELEFDCWADWEAYLPTLPLEAGVVPENNQCDHEVTHDRTISEPQCPCKNQKTMTITWTITDNCGNFDEAVRNVVIHDDTDPIISGVPQDASAECDETWTYDGITATDGCGEIQSLTDEEVGITPTDDDCPHSYIMNRLVTACDICGNCATAPYDVNFHDSTAPDFTSVPDDVEVSCEDYDGLVVAKPTADDNCAEPEVTGPVIYNLGGECVHRREEQWEYTATDDCGNEKKVNVTVTVTDKYGPVLSGLPEAELNVTCGEIPCPESVTAEDNCIGVDIDFTEDHQIHDQCVDNIVETVIRTWTATDACDNSTSFTQTIYVRDDAPPVVPDGYTYSVPCDNVTEPTLPEITDDCDEDVNCILHRSSEEGDCLQESIEHFDWQCFDNCGNFAWYNVTMEIVDDEPPSVTLPSGVENGSYAECVLPYDDLDAIAHGMGCGDAEGCDGSCTPIIHDVQNITNPECPHDVVQIVTFTGCDSCNNCDDVVFVQSSNDTIAPDMTNIPATVTYQCAAGSPPAMNAEDDCDGTISPTYDGADDSKCNAVYTRTWTATDACGNQNVRTQEVTVVDTEAPQFHFPANWENEVDIETCHCLPAEPALTATDGCEGDIEVVVTRTPEFDPTNVCEWDVTFDFTATDSCGNVNTTSVVWHISDDSPPVFNPASQDDVFASCKLPELIEPSVFDLCNDHNVVNESGRIPGGNTHCFDYLVRYNATDDCGNSADWEYTIHVQDNTAPQLTWTPAAPPAVISQKCVLPPRPSVEIEDNCDETPTLTFSNVTNIECPYRATEVRTWTWSDDCGNGNTKTSSVESTYEGPAEFGNLPSNDTLTCTKPPLVTPTATDECGGSYVPTLVSNNETEICPGAWFVKRVWEVVDVCGEKNTYTQVQISEDNDAPTYSTTLGDEVHDFLSDGVCQLRPQPDITITDTCSTPDITKSQDPDYSICDYKPVVTETWNAVDECGNEMTPFERTVTYTFDHLPTFSVTGDLRNKIHCNDSLPEPVVTATDGCGNPILLADPIVETINQTCDNEYIIRRTWTATDICGNENQLVRDVKVEDGFDPILIGVPADVTVECGCEPEPETVSAEDNCEGVDITLREWREDEDPENCCHYTIVREWVARDACGRESTPGVQRIRVRDTTPPRLVNVPADVCLNCTDELPEHNVTAEEVDKALGYCINSDNGVGDCYPGDAEDAPASLVIGDVEYSAQEAHVIKFIKEDRNALVYGTFKSAENQELYTLELHLEDSSSRADYDGDVFMGLKIECSDRVRPDLWTVYSSVSGTLTNDNSGSVIELNGAAGEVATLGAGATGLNTHMGLRVLFEDGAAHLRLDQDQVGQCNLDHIDIPELGCDHEFDVHFNDTWTGDSCVNVSLRLFWACDESDNCAIANQTITIKDQGDPFFLTVPAGGEIDCEADFPTAEEEKPTVDDDCQEPILTHSDSTTGDICTRLTLTRTWTVDDGCGNSDTATTTYFKEDKEEPILSIGSYETAGNCTYVPPVPSVSASDDCSEPTVSDWSENINNNPAGVPDCPNNYNIERSISAVDHCGKDDSFSYVVEIRDNQAPVFNEAPGALDEQLDCTDDLPTTVPTCSDECGEDISAVLESGSWTSNSSCRAVYERVWSCSDACGNKVFYGAVYTFTDGAAPTLVSGPESFTKNCSDDTEPETPVFDDNCGSVSVELVSSESTGGNPEECDPDTRILDVIEYIWVATDDCGHETDYSMQVTIVDEINPSLENVPENERHNCTEDVPCPEHACATDNCPGITLEYDEVREPLAGSLCGEKITRTWTATDRCHNVDTDSQVIIVDDEVDPVFDGEEPSDDSVYCADWDGVHPELPTATDNCGDVIVTPEHSFAPTCGDAGVWTWKFVATDACGNTAIRTWTTTIYDDVAPSVTAPADEAHQCVDQGLKEAVVSDDCDDEPYTVRYTERVNGTCSKDYTIKVFFVSTDDCNNVGTDDYTITVSDDFAPEWTSELPANVTVNCTDIPASVNLTAVDDCDGVLEVAPVEREEFYGCGKRIFREWSIEDECGHGISYTQVITVTDTVDPVFLSVPDNYTVECSDFDEFEGEATYEDNCADDLSSHTFTVNDTSDACAVVVGRHWLIADDCGNSASAVSYVTVVDTTDPDLELCDCDAEPDCVHCDQTFTCSSDEDYVAPENVPIPSSAADNCGDPTITSDYEFESLGCIERFQYHYWIKADDGCGNVDYRNFTHKVWDDVAPHFTRTLDDVVVECDDLDSLGDLTLDDTEDNCGNTAAASITGGELGDAPAVCENYTFTRTWTIEDECGNTNTTSQVVSVYDTTAPTFDGEPTVPESVSCELVDTVVQPDLTASDNCGEATVEKDSWTDHDDGDECANTYTVYWRWIATDECGHKTELVRSFPVIDVTDPSFDVPANTTVECDNIPCPDPVTADDNCDGLDLYFEEELTGDVCEHVLVRTWTAVDDCGNEFSDSQYITIEDTTKPILSDIPELEVTFECHEDEMVNLTATDNCDDDVAVETRETYTQGGCPANYTIFREWWATDECGNTNYTTQNVTVQDTIPPTVEDGGIICQRPNRYHSWVVVDDISVPNHFFGAADLCSDVAIHIKSCRSNQDNAWFLGLPADYNFTSDCDYFSANDTLVIFPRLLPGVLEGRKFVVEAEVEDACGHITPVSREIYVPYDNNSTAHAPEGFLPPGFDIEEECEPIPVECPGDCVCEYNEPLCPEGPLSDELQVGMPASSYDAASDTTTFNYVLVTTDSNRKRLTFGLDLSKVEVVSVSPDSDVLFGSIRDSYVSGITWGNLQGPGPININITLQGAVQQGKSAFQIANLGFKNSPCELGSLEIMGIDEDSVEHSIDGDLVDGKVFVNSYLGGDSEDLLLPVPGVIVELVTTDDLLNKQVLRTTATDANGDFAFHGVSTAGAKVVIAGDGFLRDATDEVSSVSRGLSGDFFTGETVDLLGRYPFGIPQPASGSLANDIHLLINPDAEVRYERDFDEDGITIEPAPVPRDPLSFNGNSKSQAFWKFQLGNFDAKKQYSASEAAALVQAADDLLNHGASCGAGFVSLDNLKTGSTIERSLIQAALNYVAGYGVFEPFRVASEYFILSAAQMECLGGGSPADHAIAQGLLDRVNSAS